MNDAEAKENQFIRELLGLVAKHEVHDSFWWKEDPGFEFYVNCNDAFYWACADCEPITAESLPDFRKALEDSEYDGPLLYVARRRQMRPQGAMYKYLERKDWPLFDACGPKREAGFGNPVDRDKLEIQLDLVAKIKNEIKRQEIRIAQVIEAQRFSGTVKAAPFILDDETMQYSQPGKYELTLDEFYAFFKCFDGYNWTKNEEGTVEEETLTYEGLVLRKVYGQGTGYSIRKAN